MKMIEINRDGNKSAILIHPMLANAALIEKLVASRMGNEYRFLIPDLSGHGTARSTGFTEVAKEADDIHAYLQHEGIFNIDFVWGASLGAAVALSLIRYVDVDFGTMVLDGTPFLKTPGFITNLIAMKMVKKHRKASRDHERSVRKMSELYGLAGPDMAEELIGIDEDSLESVIRSCASVTYPVLSRRQQEHTAFIFGSRDYNLKDAEKKIPELYPDADLKILPDLAHCGMIGSDPDGYVKLLLSYIR